MLELKNYEILCGDALERLKDIPDNTVQTCITSPPYYGLRDYGTGKWIGGDPNCKHYSGTYGNNVSVGTHKNMKDSGMPTVGFAHIMRNVCTKCGAIREDKQIGLEETPEQYINKLVEVFREVKRVLKDDGTLWINIGDTYNGTKRGNTNDINKKTNTDSFVKKLWEGAKEKDLIGIPWMLAFALRADGWYLRQDIIWHKPNPMPESVEDRCTKSHEYIFLLSKNPTYYFDYEAIEEPANYDGRNDTTLKGSDKYASGNYLPDGNPNSFASGTHERWKFKSTGIKFGGNKYGDSEDSHYQTYSGNAWTPKLKSKYDSIDQEASVRQGMHRDRGNGVIEVRNDLPSKEDFLAFIKRSSNPTAISECGVIKTTAEHWFRADSGFSYPTKEDWLLCRDLLDDGSEEFKLIDTGLTSVVIETDAVGKSSYKNLQYDGQAPNTMHLKRAEGLADEVYAVRRKRDVWSVNVASFKGAHFATFPEKLIEPCILAGSKEGDVVLDPFNGSGTTGAVSLKHKRKYIGVELNPEYIKLTEDRFDSITYVEKHVDKVTGEVTKIQMVDLF